MDKIDDLHDRIEIANRLKEIRSAKGVSQEEMAEKMGIAHITYVKLENAGHNITTKNLKKISEILNVTTDLILFGRTGVDNINFEDYIQCAKLFGPDGFESFKESIELIQRLREVDQSAASDQRESMPV